MPFTLSHAAASLPFRRFKPLWPALIIGTFAPDLEYFVRLSDEDRSGHYFPEVLLYTIPFALAVLWVFEWVVKEPAIGLLPSGLQRRLQNKLTPLRFTGSKQFGLIVLWMVAGVATHLAWDQFTHSNSWLASQWTILKTILYLPVLHTITVAHLLQHISTVGGIGALAVWFVAWYRRTPPATQTPGDEFSPWLKAAVVLTMTTIALLAGYPLAVLRMAHHPLPINPVDFEVTIFEATTLIFCAQLLIYGLAVTLGARKGRASASQLDEPHE